MSLSSTKITVNSGYTRTLKVKIGSKNSSASKFKWISSDTNVATVDSQGKITAKNAEKQLLPLKAKAVLKRHSVMLP